MQSKDLASTIETVEASWHQVFGESAPFFYNLLDQQAADLYQSEENESLLFRIFSAVSLVLGGLGLFGSSLYTAKRRFKEIGLRKVLGAETWQLIWMINRNFVKMLMIAFLVASPFAFILMNDWLSDFAYRISQPIWVYGFTGLAILLLSSLTVSYLSWKAASANPVDSIKVE